MYKMKDLSPFLQELIKSNMLDIWLNIKASDKTDNSIDGFVWSDTDYTEVWSDMDLNMDIKENNGEYKEKLYLASNDKYSDISCNWIILDSELSNMDSIKDDFLEYLI